MMVLYIGLPIHYRETLDQLVERVQLIRKKEREIKTLEAKMSKEKQFNRKVEINSQIRTLHTELKDLQ